MKPTGLYVHIPFCRRRCRYCDFVSSVFDEGRAERYVDALLAEAAQHQGTGFRTAYIGGGTPTVLGGALLEKLLAGLPLDGVGEFTVEANPESVTRETAEILARYGVNRISLGVQSFHDGLLAALGRVHDAARAKEAFALLRGAGFRNISLDLMFAIPGETMATLDADLAQALALAPEHISYYCLSYEEGTELHSMRADGRVAQCSEAQELAMYRRVIETLSAPGFRHYEISSFARPGFACAHNLNYWRNGDYVGLGAGASSHTGGERRTNEKDIERYIEKIRAQGAATVFAETLVGEKKEREMLVLGLRMIDGVDAGRFEGMEPLADEIHSLRAQGLLDVSALKLHLTGKGLFVADSVMETLV